MIIYREKTDSYTKIIKCLATQTIIELNDGEIFEKEGKNYIDFALNYYPGAQAQQKPATEDQPAGEDEADTVNDGVASATTAQTDPALHQNLVKMSLSLAQGQYRRLIEVVYALHENGIVISDKKAVQNFI